MKAAMRNVKTEKVDNPPNRAASINNKEEDNFRDGKLGFEISKYLLHFQKFKENGRRSLVTQLSETKLKWQETCLQCRIR
jgi:hypothetical protein